MYKWLSTSPLFPLPSYDRLFYVCFTQNEYNRLFCFLILITNLSFAVQCMHSISGLFLRAKSEKCTICGDDCGAGDVNDGEEVQDEIDCPSANFVWRCDYRLLLFMYLILRVSFTMSQSTRFHFFYTFVLESCIMIFACKLSNDDCVTCHMASDVRSRQRCYRYSMQWSTGMNASNTCERRSHIKRITMCICEWPLSTIFTAVRIRHTDTQQIFANTCNSTWAYNSFLWGVSLRQSQFYHCITLIVRSRCVI